MTTNADGRTPVAYVVQSLSDGSIDSKIAPVGYAMFESRMLELQDDAWVKNGRSRIVPLYLHPSPSPAGDSGEKINAAPQPEHRPVCASPSVEGDSRTQADGAAPSPERVSEDDSWPPVGIRVNALQDRIHEDTPSRPAVVRRVSETPRTDALRELLRTNPDDSRRYMHMQDLSRTLERELTAALATIAEEKANVQTAFRAADLDAKETAHWKARYAAQSEELRLTVNNEQQAIVMAQEAEVERNGMRKDVARYRWLRDNINYSDEIRGTLNQLSWHVRCWKHDSNDFVSATIDAAIDNALSARDGEANHG